MSRMTAAEYLNACQQAGTASGSAGVQLDRWLAARQADALDRIAAALEKSSLEAEVRYGNERQA